MGCLTGRPWVGVQYFSTTRTGGVSTAPWDSLNLGQHVGDDPQAVEDNRARVRQCLPSAPRWLDQVHGSEVWDADRASSASPPRADAAVTTQPGRVLAIMTADCLPVVMADRAGQVLGMAHAGWRGLAAGVLENTLAAMRQRMPGASLWRAWIGPAISQAHFEVGREVYEAFVSLDPRLEMFFAADGSRDRWHADLPGIAHHRLFHAGVQQIECSGACTYEDAERFFSYRRASQTGRQATLAWLGTSASDLP
ncbi:peptidoglycan editing factor PgeF [Alcaligenaceae bacterium CGII-47]|nr:peptidoglycan editing factor PgeF [Alcaligenaceae bacterium CGII-47]